MKTFIVLTIWALVGATTALHAAQDEWVQQAVSPDPGVALAAQDKLRDMGPDGLKALNEAYQKYLSQFSSFLSGGAVDEQSKRFKAALNRVGGQYDEDASGLYWYTDFEKAKAAAQASGKPILSLRLLGRLDEDLSCANSRFFRTTLYPNAQVNAVLRDKFILHWESVRPVPVVTIDFGNGRKLVRTITGNSIHYVLNPSGEIVDALPGLYSAAVFSKELEWAAAAVRQDASTTLSAYQDDTQKRLLAAWQSDLVATGLKMDDAVSQISEANLESLTDDKTWKLIAARHESEVTFDPASQVVMTRKFPAAEVAAPLAISKRFVESPLLRAIQNLKSTVSLDTVRNNYMMRTKILAYIEGPMAKGCSLSQINDGIYANIFLTPRNDPWLGLDATDGFAGIDQGGKTK